MTKESMQHPVVRSAADLSQLIGNGKFRYALQRVSLGAARQLPGRWFEWLIRPVVVGAIVNSDDFVKAVSSLNLSQELDLRVFEDSLNWLSRQCSDTRLTIRISGQSIANWPLSTRCCSLIEQQDVSPKQVCFSLSADDVLEDLSATAEFIQTMRREGCLIALDPGEPRNPVLELFGAMGLINYAIINRRWVEPALLSQPHRQMLRNQAECARQLNLKVIAQGVNNSGLLELVRNSDVDYCQGLVNGEPVIIDEPNLHLDLLKLSCA